MKYYYLYLFKNFFFDKVTCANYYSRLKIIKIFLSVKIQKNLLFKSQISKILLLLYFWTGIKPFILVKTFKASGRGLKKKKITNIILILRKEVMFKFLQFLVLQKIFLIKTYQKLLANNFHIFSFTFTNFINDEDLLLKIFSFKNNFKINVSLYMNNVINFSYIEACLIALKFFFVK